MDYILAKAFAGANDTEQGEMINTIARELFVRSGGRYSGRGLDGYETQCCYISKHLNADGVTFIKDLHAFIELREKEMKP